jgi:acetyltransferase
LKLLLADAGVDSALVILPPPPMYTAGAVAKALIPVIHNAEKPVVVALMGERLIQEAVEHFRAARVPEYRFPERAASALAVLAQRAEYLAAAGEGDVSAGRPEHLHPEEARSILEQFLQPPVIASAAQPSQAQPDVIASAAKQSPLQLPQEAIQRLLAAYGIATLPVRLAHSAEEAAQIASELGFPAAVKVASPDISHKSDAGGVLLDLPDTEAVRGGFETVVQKARLARPQAEIQGAHVQRMLPAGQDVIAGVVQDAQFGPLVMFGSGGVEVEGLKDVAFALAPLSRAEAEYLLEHTWAGRKLRGYRSLPPADREAVLEALLRLAQLAEDFPELKEIEINPLRVLEEGEGAVALDVRAQIA